MADETFAAERDRLRTALTALANVAEERESLAAADSARALDKKLVENRFNVVVFGEFKRGKTTFVNALLGAEMLPAAVVPLTSIVTAVTWGDDVRARISYLEGREEDVAPRELGRYVTERDNPGNHLAVRQAILSYPSDDLRDGVFLVDTPGVGSVYRQNTESAREFLPHADAAIFLTSADPPISDTEREFLGEIREEAARVFFVMNKMDYLSGLDRDEAIAFTQGVIADALGRAVILYPMSARQALVAKLVGDDAELEARGSRRSSATSARSSCARRGRRSCGRSPPAPPGWWTPSGTRSTCRNAPWTCRSESSIRSAGVWKRRSPGLAPRSATCARSCRANGTRSSRPWRRISPPCAGMRRLA